MSRLLSPVAGVLAKRRLAKWQRQLTRIAAIEVPLSALEDHELKKRSLALRYRARSGESLDDLLPEAFGLVRQAARRTLDMHHYEVQVVGGIAMHCGSIVEMQTGEGKTLTATLPMYLASLRGRGAHLATANDYLARRDAEWMRPVYELLGVSVGVIESQTPRHQRSAAYQCDVTYGTAKEFGFDFLRDRLLSRPAEQAGRNTLAAIFEPSNGKRSDAPVQRDLHFALVDEADSILIDEARTPLIVSSLPDDSEEAAEELYRWASSVAPSFEEVGDFQHDAGKRVVTLSAAGRRRVRELPQPTALATVPILTLYEHVERAIKVEREMFRDRHYVVRDDEVVIVDEFTGRLAEGRRWRSGIHQACEAREGLPISHETGDAARVTVQDFFLRYDRLAGMTGTAANSAPELRKIYRTKVVTVPTNRPPRRTELPDAVFASSEAKWEAIVEDVLEIHLTGRPVLIGTRSIDKSEHLSALLDSVGVEHQVLNASRIAAEAEIVAAAGQRGKVTVATNMAGRGTDIKLTDEVRESGGLHVICSELHESQRIDRQLIGRCGRQGDPGSFRRFVSLDDDLLATGLGSARAERLRRRALRQSGSLDHLAGIFRLAQAKVQRQHFRLRRNLLYVESERRKLQLQMGQDPYLDSPS